MNKKAPQLKLIQGGKKSSKVVLSMGLFLICGMIFLSVLIIVFGV